MEYCSRSIVMAVQVMAGMWKRNGYSVVNQIINYQYHHSREIMYDKDILMLQVIIANTILWLAITNFHLAISVHGIYFGSQYLLVLIGVQVQVGKVAIEVSIVFFLDQKES